MKQELLTALTRVCCAIFVTEDQIERDAKLVRYALPHIDRSGPMADLAQCGDQLLTIYRHPTGLAWSRFQFDLSLALDAYLTERSNEKLRAIEQRDAA